jgi:hypothetical protein
MRRLGVALACLIVLVGDAHGYDPTGKSPISVFHLTSRGQYAEDRKLPRGSGANGSDRIYIAGWLSALNAVVRGTDIHDDAALDNVMLWLDSYCFNNPSASMQAGLMEFSHQLAPSSVPALTKN